MGTWGPGTLDNDQGQNYFGDFVSNLARKLKRDLTELEAGRGDDYEFLAVLTCLRALAMGIDKTAYSLQRSQVVSWRDRYVAWFDRSSNGWGTNDTQFLADYLAHVCREFDQLIGQLQEWDPDEWVE